ncbi:MAG TPA: PIN domain-containing protein [Levilinea sp.]|nr:PIN domain-containing protein [Levilinea sp.]
MSFEFILRLIGMIVFAVIGVYWGTSLGFLANLNPESNTFSVEQYAFILGLVGALVGLILTPFITTRPFTALRALFARVSAHTLLASLIGLVVGLLIAALLAFPFSLLPPPFGRILPFVGVILFGYLGVAVLAMRQNDLFSMLSTISGRSGGATAGKEGGVAGSGNWGEGRTILLDTSVIIDGRIADIARTGFLPGTLLIPRFVLTELQYIADSSDSLRRQRGRRGMEVLSQLQRETVLPVKMSDIDVEGVREVDDKLVILARQLRCPVLTNDYNLNRIAELQGVTVLNINELANAVKSVLLPGEMLAVRIIQEGKEYGQGVGYMDDGTMVVVENGRDYKDKEIAVLVTKVLQTAAGRMIFARPEERVIDR